VPSAVEQLLLPAECLLCRQLLSFQRSMRMVCDLCRHRWRPVTPPWCERCGQPGPHFGPCRVCADWPAALCRARSAVWLDAGARAAVHALKYGGWPRIGDDLADALARRVPAPPPGAVLVPVPLGQRRLRRRGYNQSARLAAALGARWSRPVRDELLRRVRDTATQTTLTPEARMANVAGAFAVANAECGVRNGNPHDDSALHIPHSALVLVDDVFTTGATLAECARALAGAGWDRVEAVTFGRALIPDFT
jgi:ComF family protein